MTLTKRAQWRRSTGLPKHDCGEWEILDGRKIRRLREDEVIRRLQRWQPMQPILVGAPDQPTFLPPSAIPQLASTVAAFRSRSKKGLLALAVATLSLFLVWLGKSAHTGGPFYAIAALLTMVACVDYFAFLRHDDVLSERAQFFHWLQTSRQSRSAFAMWAAIAVSMGVVQVCLQLTYGSLEQVVQRYGTMFEPTRDGEIWRLVTGPFFHASTAHYLNNAIMLLLVGPIASVVASRISLGVFLVGSTFAAAAEMLLSTAGFDSYVGISGGVFALFGFVVMLGALDRGVLPKGFTILCALSGIASAAGVELLSSRAATIAHLTGSLVGIVIGAVLGLSRSHDDGRR